MTARFVGDAERRARLVRRHGLASPFDTIAEATEALVAWHATENSTVYLSIAARVAGVTVADIDRALYDERSLVKQMAMRRTIFAFDRTLLPAAVAGPRPEIDVKIHVAPGTKWGGEAPLAPRLMTILSAAGEVVRGPNDGHWRRSRPRWVTMETWLGEQLARPEDPYDQLVTAWLLVFGPGTETDLVWWFGSTKTVIRQALARIGAVEVGIATSTSDRMLPSSSTPPATAATPRGGRAGSSAAGSSTRTAGSRCNCSRRCPPRASPHWRNVRSSWRHGWGRRASSPTSPPRSWAGDAA